MTNKMITALSAAALLALTACGGDGDDALGDNVADAAEMKADNLEDMADNASTESQEEALDAQADLVEEMGDAKEEAIDDADVNAHAMSPAEKESLTNGM